MYLPDAFWIFVAAIVAMIFWKIYGARISAALDRFDRRRIDADRQLIADMQNPLAHFRRSLDAINEQVEPVKLMKSGPDGVAIVMWNGEVYEDVDSAEDARWRSVITKARSFYRGLDEDFGLRVAGPAPRTARDA